MARERVKRAEPPRINPFASREALAVALAERVADRLSDAIAARGDALLAVSGGTTPALFFDALSRRDIDWPRVAVTLVDERFVDESSPRSNAALVRSKLLQNNAAKARFFPLFAPGLAIKEAAARAGALFFSDGEPERRLDVAVLGMGSDGHTASFFPDARELDALLDPAAKPGVSPVHARSAGEPRLTMNLPAIASARFLALHIEGPQKRAVLDEATSRNSWMPITSVLRVAPVEIFWAP